jgi:hypothetical protein
VQSPWKTVERVLKKLKMDRAYNPAIPLLVIYLKEYKSGSKTVICMFTFIAIVFTIGKIWKQTRCPTIDEWMKKCGIQ